MTICATRGANRGHQPLAASRIWRAALLGASISALTLSGAFAETPDAKVATAPANAAATDQIDSTGSIDAEAPAADKAAPAAEQAPAAVETPAPATPGSVEAIHATDPLSAAVTALLATDGAGASLKLPAADRATLIAFYAARNGSPAWIKDGAFTSAADAARGRIAAAADDGLDPKRFALPAAPASTEPGVLARADVTLSAAALAYARQAWGGRVNPSLISRSISVGTPPFDAGAALLTLSASPDVAATLDGFNPPTAQFQALRKQLVAKRAEHETATRHPIIAEGKLLKPGVEDDRVPSLRVRLGLAERSDDLAYDDELVEAVTAFQKDRKLGASGLVNRQTLRALNAEGRVDQTSLLLANMERWRWMPRDLGAKHVFVDLANFHLNIVENGKQTYETRVIIGKATNQTPMLSSAINQVVVNPYWNVPVSIALNELSRGSLRGFEVVDSRGKVVDPGSVDWAGIKANKFRIRQPPGERNALGHIKFLFPNRYAVYLHDTPSRKLFANDFRALSHGCVRVDRPLEFADALTGDQGLSGAKLEKMVGGKERGLPVATTIPVHLAYLTAWVRDDGTLETRSDLYDQDARIKAALSGEPVPALPPEPVIALAPRPKPERRQATAATDQVQEMVVDQRAPRSEGFGSWLSRVFGDSRQRP